MFIGREQELQELNTIYNQDKFSAQVFQYYGETTLEPFTSWENALTYICDRQNGRRLILVFDEFPYLADAQLNFI